MDKILNKIASENISTESKNTSGEKPLTARSA